ncbi:MAG TPA: hypothetical protein VHE60_01260 [Pyrinomonadaceae bacterium]|nr:hypothetical protein [Pyrinomonadaceae bacterium]
MDRLITDLDRQFSQLHQESRELIQAISPELLYCRPPGGKNSSPAHSCGEQILRSAAAVEQTFGGITTNLWDDPFEWTLPETLSTPEKVADYLSEVEATRKRGFELFKSDDDLLKEIMAPAGETQLRPLLLDTLVRARHYLGSARATFDLLRAEGPKLTTDH